MSASVGLKFSFLTVVADIGFKYPSSRNRYVRVQCECGRFKEVQLGALVAGQTKSCGRCRQTTHGFGQTPIYYAWARMMSRCYNKKNASYNNYGARDISVCERWHSVASFAEDMLPTFRKGLQLDRINNNGNYEPSNCRWATSKENANNRRTNILLTVDGATKTLTEWGEITGLRKHVIHYRLKAGWPADAAVLTPLKRRGPQRRPQSTPT